MLLVVARAKILAVFLGPGGIGLLAQLNSFDTLVSTLVSIGIGYGITNLISRAQGKDAHLASEADIIRTGEWLLLLAYAPISLISIVGSRYLAIALLKEEKLAHLFLILAAGFLFQFFAFFFESIMQGYKAIKEIALARVTSSVLGFVAVVPLAWFLGIDGAVIGIVAWFLFRFLMFYFFGIRSGINWLALWSRGKFHIRKAGIMFKFGSTAFLTNALNALVLLFIRTQIVHHLGSAANGIYQVVWAVSSQYLILVPHSLWAYAYPRITEIVTDEKKVRSELNQTLRLGLLLITPVIFGILSMRDFMIRLLYTPEFLLASKLLLIQIWGDLLRLIVWWMELPLYAAGKLRRVVIIETSGNLGYLVIGSTLLHSLELPGVCIGYTAAGGLAIIVALLGQKRNLQPLCPENRILLIQSAIFLVIGMLIPQKRIAIWGIVVTILVALWAVWVLRKEWRHMLHCKTGDE